MQELILKIEQDIKINERCLKEETKYSLRRILELWIQYDKELLEMAKEINNENE